MEFDQAFSGVAARGVEDVNPGRHREVAKGEAIHDTVSSYLYERTKRRPMVLPVIMQV